MATRRRLAQSQATRQRIRTAMVLRRLEAFALGEPDPQTGRPVRMRSSDVRAAFVLLRKTLPDLRAVEAAAASSAPGGYLVMHGEDGAARELALASRAA